MDAARLPVSTGLTDPIWRSFAADLSAETGRDVTWTHQGFLIAGRHVSSPHAVRIIAMAIRLGEVRRDHPGWSIGRNPFWPYRWEADRRPRPTTLIFLHAGTLDELEARLSVEPVPC